jgi:GTP cyclohydrolase I
MTSDQAQTTDVSLDAQNLQSVDDKDDQSIDFEKAQRGVRLLLESIGEDPDEGALVETWERRVPETLETLSNGYRDDEKPTMRTFEAENDDLVVKTGIPVHSLCEHHLLPYSGTAHVAYRPDGEVVGLSKLTRYVRWQSRRLTVQEQLTHDIAEELADELGAEVVIVDVAATHFCEVMRGVETASETRTTATVGDPTDIERQRFREAINRTSD